MPINSLVDLHPHMENFRAAVLAGLGQRPKKIAPKFFYDRLGSELFEEITTSEEYYPTRTEISILEKNSREISELLGKKSLLLEYGAGASRKIRILLDAMPDLAAFVPLDISGEHLVTSCQLLEKDYPDLLIAPVCADYSHHLDLPLPEQAKDSRRIIFFPGSTVGNMHHDEARSFLHHAADLAGPGGGMLIGVDLIKDPAVLNAAYNDQAGTTERFNMNLLTRINRELDGNFQLEQFRHHARFVEDKSRMEMHLVSLCQQQVTVAGQTFSFQPEETIHSECSYKFTIDSFKSLAKEAGFTPQNVWTDPNGLFSVHYLVVD